ncbi:MAG: hypothetical protein JSR66_08420 [Proteobacteria bacterium]|nr:hypothetical protein [Pseudomonadota bacterium]
MYPPKLGERNPGTHYSTRSKESRPARFLAACFPQAWVGFCRPPSASLNLDPQCARGLSELLQVLSCGEESATVTFESLAHSCHEPWMRSALMRIAADERRHHVLLSNIGAALPTPRIDPKFAARMRRFFMRLAHRDVLVHFVKIATLDSAACQVLSLLRAGTGPLTRDGAVGSILRLIHIDEARHVRLARECAGSVARSRKGTEIAAEVTDELAQLIQMRADSLEALHIDPDRLDARLRTVPASFGARRCRA